MIRKSTSKIFYRLELLVSLESEKINGGEKFLADWSCLPNLKVLEQEALFNFLKDARLSSQRALVIESGIAHVRYFFEFFSKLKKTNTLLINLYSCYQNIEKRKERLFYFHSTRYLFNKFSACKIKNKNVNSLRGDPVAHFRHVTFFVDLSFKLTSGTFKQFLCDR